MPRVLVANRGEIAARILRACREQGHETVAVHSSADAGASYLELADQALCIGPGPPQWSYLSGHNLLSAALATKADAIHPGYGFLAEDAQFADQVLNCGMGWIGPRPEFLRLSGDKAAARRFAAEHGVPVVPGSAGTVEGVSEMLGLAERLGYPVLIKANHGGGGRGMRRVANAEELLGSYRPAEREAAGSSGRGSLYLERALSSVRHLEVQLLGDGLGGVRAYAERHCSLQLRHQKVIEESPAPHLSVALRSGLRRYAEHLGRAAQLKSAATVEFLVDDADRVYFLEINPRLQVEHGLTELVHGVDLVHAQLQLEFGDPVAALSWVDPLQGSPGTQVASGHAIECRINAEHPLTGWPSPGRIESVDWPQGSGVRIDTYLRSGSQVPPYYDSLLAKILVWGADRSAAVIRMQEALRTVRIRGVMTNLDLLVAAMAHPDFTHERYDTALLPRLVEQLRATSAASEQKSRSAW